MRFFVCLSTVLQSTAQQASGWSDIYLESTVAASLTSPPFLFSSSSSSSGSESLPRPSSLPLPASLRLTSSASSGSLVPWSSPSLLWSLLPAKPVLDPSRRPWLAMPRRHCSLQPTHRQNAARWAAMLRTCQKDGPWQPSLPSLPSMPLQPPQADPDESGAVAAPPLTRPHFQRPA